MGLLFYTETPENAVFNDAKHVVGERIKVIQIKVHPAANYCEKTLKLFESCAEQEFTITEVLAYEMDDTEDYHFTYEIEIGEMDSVYLDEDEIETIK